MHAAILHTSSAFIKNNGTCNKYSTFVVVEARLYELEAQLCTVENEQTASQVSLVSTKPPSVASVANPISCPLEESEQPGPQTGWVTVRKRKHYGEKIDSIHLCLRSN